MSDSPDGQIKQFYSFSVSVCWHVYFGGSLLVYIYRRPLRKKTKFPSGVGCARGREDKRRLTSAYLKAAYAATYVRRLFEKFVEFLPTRGAVVGVSICTTQAQVM